MVRCKECSLAYLSPRWPEARVRELYAADDYYAPVGTGYSGYERQARSLQMTFHRFLRRMAARGLTGGALLEVGCGFGYLLAAARPYFHTTVGTDYSPAAAREAARVADGVFTGGLEAVPVGRHFDTIVLNQVIEHVYRPLGFLVSLKERLRPGGRIVLATPDMNSPLRYLLGHRWPSYKIPEHVLYFDESTLRAALTASGFVRIGRLPYPHAFPLGVLAEKFRLPIPGFLDQWPIWVPWTTLALYGEKES